MSTTLKIGDTIKDNDPRRGYERTLQITDVDGDEVICRDNMTFRRAIKRSRIFTDGRRRNSGYNLVTE